MTYLPYVAHRPIDSTMSVSLVLKSLYTSEKHPLVFGKILSDFRDIHGVRLISDLERVKIFFLSFLDLFEIF